MCNVKAFLHADTLVHFLGGSHLMSFINKIDKDFCSSLLGSTHWKVQSKDSNQSVLNFRALCPTQPNATLLWFP